MIFKQITLAQSRKYLENENFIYQWPLQFQTGLQFIFHLQHINYEQPDLNSLSPLKPYIKFVSDFVAFSGVFSDVQLATIHITNRCKRPGV